MFTLAIIFGVVALGCFVYCAIKAVDRFSTISYVGFAATVVMLIAQFTAALGGSPHFWR